MKIITEIDLRAQYSRNNFETYHLENGSRLTPAALQFLNERRIKITDSNDHPCEKGEAQKTVRNNRTKIDLSQVDKPREGFICLPSGKHVLEKPEHYTHLKANILVAKCDPIIKFRGQLDLTEANFVTCINQVVQNGYREMADDLEEILLYLQKIMRAEVFNEPLPFIDFKGWTDAEVREFSHHPDKYFGVKHALPNPKYGNIHGEINKLRAMTRQLEIAAVESFYDEETDQCDRLDISMALNRLSSLIYIIMCKFAGGLYKIG